MKTETKEVKTFITRLYCDCGSEMKTFRSWNDGSGIKSIYQCPNCETVSETIKGNYPKVEYRETPEMGGL